MTTCTDFDEITIAELHTALRLGMTTTATVVDWYLNRIEKHGAAGTAIQAVVTVNPHARDEAIALDTYFRTRGHLAGPLHGVPVLIKDQAETAEIRTTFGSIAFADYIPAHDATVVARLKQAGAIVLAKTTMNDFGVGWFSSSSMSDRTSNPYCFERDSGGASSGTGAGVAANLGLVGVGADTGGSVRIPASFNNLFGLRPSVGMISRTGFSPVVHFQDTPGPMTRTVADLALLLDGLVGYDSTDPSTAVVRTAPGARRYSNLLNQEPALDKWRLGVLESAFGSDSNPDARPVNQVTQSALACLATQGAEVVSGLRVHDLDQWINETSLYVEQSKIDIDAFLARRPWAPASSLAEIYEEGHFHPSIELFHDLVKGPDELAGNTGYFEGRLHQRRFQRMLLDVMARNQLDFLVYPTVQVIPPRHTELAAFKYDNDSFPTNTLIASHSDLPALSVPVGFTAAGLPVGMEVLAAPYAEDKLVQFAHAWEQIAKPRRSPSL